MSALTIGLANDPDVLLRVLSGAMPPAIDVTVLPELFDGGYAALRRGEGIHSLYDDRLSTLRLGTVAKEPDRFAVTCVAGSVRLQSPAGRFTNTSLVFRAGRLVHRYDKIHLFHPCGDHTYFDPGDRIRTFGLSVGGRMEKAGVIICYDLRFPELVRAMALRGISILFVPARWPAVRDAVWQTLLRARAIENQIFVVGCNARDQEGGNSYVFDPFGEMLFSSRDVPDRDVHTIQLEMSRIQEAYRFHRNIREARVLRHMTVPAILSGMRRLKGRTVRGRSKAR
jgi:predicted amidohydrolase